LPPKSWFAARQTITGTVFSDPARAVIFDVLPALDLWNSGVNGVMWWGRTTANSAEEKGWTDLRDEHNNPSYRGATKGGATKEGQAWRNKMLD
jgi:hypothetical protein